MYRPPPKPESDLAVDGEESKKPVRDKLAEYLQQITLKKQEEERKKKEKEEKEAIKRQKLKDKVLQGAKIESKFLKEQDSQSQSSQDRLDEDPQVMAVSEENPNLGKKGAKRTTSVQARTYATLGLQKQQTEQPRALARSDSQGRPLRAATAQFEKGGKPKAKEEPVPVLEPLDEAKEQELQRLQQERRKRAEDVRIRNEKHMQQVKEKRMREEREKEEQAIKAKLMQEAARKEAIKNAEKAKLM